MAGKELPSLSGVKLKTRKRDEKVGSSGGVSPVVWQQGALAVHSSATPTARVSSLISAGEV